MLFSLFDTESAGVRIRDRRSQAKRGAVHSNDCTGGKLGEPDLLPVGLGSAAGLVLDAPMVTTELAGVAGDFCSGLSGFSGGGCGCGSPIGLGGRTPGVLISSGAWGRGTAASTGCCTG